MRRLLITVGILCAALEASAGTGRILIVNTDKPGVGFNDATPVVPVGGNEGTTLGEQRLNVFREAARRWESALDVDVNIMVSAAFPSIPGCDATKAILGQAAPMSWKHSFPGAPRENVWYPISLANQLAGFDLEVTAPDIFMQFNGDVDNQTCLGATDWYYGFDGQHGDDTDLFVVVLHEIAHGLGVSGATAAPGFLFNRPSTFDTHLLDRTLGLRWEQMSEAQRAISIVNTGNLVWEGSNVRSALTQFLRATTTLTITEPALIARNYDIGLAAFGPDASKTALSGRIVGATDPADLSGPTTTDGCSAFTNASAIQGNIALVDRGTCPFVMKARNAQAAGASALLVVDNSRETCAPPGMGGTAEDVLIPVFSISANDGDSLKTQLPTQQVNGTLRIDPTQLAGASQDGYIRLYTPCTIQRGSSTHHFDVSATPNLLMEPNINSDLLHGFDLTLYQLVDMGWRLADRTGRRFLIR